MQIRKPPIHNTQSSRANPQDEDRPKTEHDIVDQKAKQERPQREYTFAHDRSQRRFAKDSRPASWLH